MGFVVPERRGIKLVRMGELCAGTTVGGTSRRTCIGGGALRCADSGLSRICGARVEPWFVGGGSCMDVW
jgi:hypothetical protein